MAESGSAARKGALALLDQVLIEKRLLSEATQGAGFERLLPADRARAQRLALGTLRGLERADRLLAEHLRKPPPDVVQNVLRLGIHELVEGEAAHGVVHDLVQIVGRDRRHASLKGLVNAVLRKMAVEAPEAWDAMRAPRLPDWLRAPLIAAWGKDAVAAIEAAHLAGAPLDLTPRPGASTNPDALEALVLPNGSWRRAVGAQVSALPGFAEGDWWVQDAAAAIPVQVLAPQPGETIADLCAAPGGKTLQIASAGAQVTAIDDSDTRLHRLRDNLDRTALPAMVLQEDLLHHQASYDAVLLDAPCSATGTVRRHPDLPFAKDGSEFAALIDLQTRMLDHAWGLVRPGGRLVYCTCSLLPDEGEVQIEEALSRHQDMAVDRAALDRPGIDPNWQTEEGGLRLRPDFWTELGGMDGFYVAALRKAG